MEPSVMTGFTTKQVRQLAEANAFAKQLPAKVEELRAELKSAIPKLSVIDLDWLIALIGGIQK